MPKIWLQRPAGADLVLIASVTKPSKLRIGLFAPVSFKNPRPARVRRAHMGAGGGLTSI